MKNKATLKALGQSQQSIAHDEPRFFSTASKTKKRKPLCEIQNEVPTKSTPRLSKRIRGPSIKYAEYVDVPKNLSKLSPVLPPVVIPPDFQITELADIIMGGEDKSLLQTGTNNTFSAVQFSDKILEKYGKNISDIYGIRRGRNRFYATDPSTLSIPAYRFAEATQYQTMGELRAYLHLSQHECVPRAVAFWIDKEGHLNILMEKYTYLLHQLVDVRSQGNMPDEEHMVKLYMLLKKLAKAGHFHDDMVLDNIVRDDNGRFRFLDPGEINLMAEDIDTPTDDYNLSKIDKEPKIPEQFIALDYSSGANITCEVVDGKFILTPKDMSIEGPQAQTFLKENEDGLFSLLEFKFDDLWRRTVINKLKLPIPPRDAIRRGSWKRVCEDSKIDFEAYQAQYPYDPIKSTTAPEDASCSLSFSM